MCVCVCRGGGRGGRGCLGANRRLKEKEQRIYYSVCVWGEKKIIRFIDVVKESKFWDKTYHNANEETKVNILIYKCNRKITMGISLM